MTGRKSGAITGYRFASPGMILRHMAGSPSTTPAGHLNGEPKESNLSRSEATVISHDLSEFERELPR